MPHSGTLRIDLDIFFTLTYLSRINSEDIELLFRLRFVPLVAYADSMLLKANRALEEAISSIGL